MQTKRVIFVTGVVGLVFFFLACGPTLNHPDGGTSTEGGYAPGSQGLMQPCKTNADCTDLYQDGGACVNYQGKGEMLCSKRCSLATGATDCPTPPTGGACNGMGFCKAP